MIDIKLEDVQPGTVLRLKAAKGAKYRKVYKTITNYVPGGYAYGEVWGIVMYWSEKKREFVEECGMTSNRFDKFSYICTMDANGDWQEDRVEIHL